MPKCFINKKEELVEEVVDGTIWSTPDLGRLTPTEGIKVVYRTDWKKDRVALVSGGGAGHEPMHGGFVGRGMLTAAVTGETFASPTIDAVLAAIVQVTGQAGCLLIIKNYTGDRLNFGRAAQRARTEFGLSVRVVITKDDVATKAERGIAGTLFVHKVAGAAAEAGKSLDDVEAYANKVIGASASLGVSLSSNIRERAEEGIAEGKMEVGLGIHGEPGYETRDILPAKEIVDLILEKLLDGSEKLKPVDKDTNYAVLLNNLGGVPAQEMAVLMACLMKSKWNQKFSLLIGPAPLCTSLNMNGFSISILMLTSPEMRHYLAEDTSVGLWPRALAPCFPEPATPAVKSPLDDLVGSADAEVCKCLESICQALVKSEDSLNELDGKVGDSDCGSTMKNAAISVLSYKDKLPLADPKATCSALAAITSKAMGGSSGVLMSIMFGGMAESFEKSGKKTWAEGGAVALEQGLQAMSDAGGATTGKRTMLDAFVPAAKALKETGTFAAASAAAEKGKEDTKDMPPRAGRAENVPESAWRGVPDPGAVAVTIAFAALAGAA